MEAPLQKFLQPALTAEAMREADRFTIEEIGIPGFTLMESAGRAAVGRIVGRYGAVAGKSVACFCGKGNNGGDGLVVARLLALLGARIEVFLMAPPAALSLDAAHNHEILSHLAVQDDKLDVRFSQIDEHGHLPDIPEFDLVVDGLLGTGVTRTLSERYLSVVDLINGQEAPVVALDLPTGLHADTGQILGDAIRADLTVTMGALKAGLLMGEGPAYAGKIEVVEMGIPEIAIARAAAYSGCPHVVTGEAVRSWLPVRPFDAHKYSVGMALVVAGSPGLTGAATLASTSAARGGAGAVICATDLRVQDLLAVKMTEVMTLGLPSTMEGIDADEARAAMKETLSRAAALLVGCGMGRKPETERFIRDLVVQSTIPVVIDADGLNAFTGHTDLFGRHGHGRWILTPHVGEFMRLAGRDVDLTDRISTVRLYSKAWNCVLVLKGAPTIVGTPEGRVFINPTINPALATAGMGDVLAGLCAGFLAQGLSPVKAALTALYISGTAVDRYTDTHHPATMLASDVIDLVTQVMSNMR